MFCDAAGKLRFAQRAVRDNRGKSMEACLSEMLSVLNAIRRMPIANSAPLTATVNEQSRFHLETAHTYHRNVMFHAAFLAGDRHGTFKFARVCRTTRQQRYE
jgi:hypothetical protein